MSSKHFFKYFQKYHIFLSFAILVWFLYACNSTKKVPNGEYLLTKNNFEYVDRKDFDEEIPNFVSQKPNKKDLYLFPTRLWIYNMANAKYDSILNEYQTFPRQMRNQKLRDSLYVKYNHPELKGNSLFWNRVWHSLGKPPIILEQGKTETSANSIKKFLVYKGFWDAHVDFSHKLDSAAKKAQANYKITYKDPTYINGYYYNIPYENIRNIYEQKITESKVKSGAVLDQEKLEDEVKRITELMQEKGYYSFNRDGGEIYFTADTLQSRKQVPLTMDILKDTLKTPYKQYTIGNVEIQYLEKLTDTANVDVKEYENAIIKRIDDQYKVKALWRPITLKKGEIYNQKNLDLTKRNFLALNNFSIASYKASPDKYSNPNDTIINVKYKLIPLPKYNFKTALDLHYSQILNFGFSPSAELTARNVFGGAENFTGSVSGTFGTVYDEKNPNALFNASEYSLQFGLNFPRLLLPFNTEKFVPNKYSPVSTVNLGASVQNNIGMDRINVNAGLNYFITVNEVISHRFSVFNTQFSFTRNKNKYYELFKTEGDIKDGIFNLYDIYNPSAINLDTEAKSRLLLNDTGFANSLSPTGLDLLLNFRQSTIKKDRLTQDVLINSLAYNYIYNEIGKKGYQNPFFLDAKVELAGNLLSIFSKNNTDSGVLTNSKTIFGIPISQFVKFDIDARKYFTFKNKSQFIVRQFIGVGIPYGNSSNMPFIRSYFNGGSNDIRAWIAFGGLGPADTQIDQKVRAYMMDNVKLTTNIEYRYPFNEMFEGAVFADAGNIWSTKDSGIGDEFKFNKFISQMGLGSGFGLRMHVAYITVRIDLAYKLHDPNQPKGERWVFDKIKPFKPTFNFSIGYPF